MYVWTPAFRVRTRTLALPFTLGAVSNRRYDRYRVLELNSGRTIFRVRGPRIVDNKTSQVVFRIRDDTRIVDAEASQVLFRIRNDGRVVDSDSGELRYRLKP